MDNQNNGGNSTTNQNNYNNQINHEQQLRNEEILRTQQDNSNRFQEYQNNYNMNHPNSINNNLRDIISKNVFRNNMSRTRLTNSDSENIENDNNMQNLQDNIERVQETVESAKRKAEFVKKVSAIINTAPVWGPIVGVCAFIIIFVVLYQSLRQDPTNMFGTGKSNYNNLGIGYTFVTSSIKNKVSNLDTTYDKGLLYATINAGVVINQDVYDSSENSFDLSNESAYDEYRDSNPLDFEVNSSNAWSFYNARSKYLDKLIENMKGYDITVLCSNTRPNTGSQMVTWSIYVADNIVESDEIINFENTYNTYHNYDLSSSKIAEYIAKTVTFNGRVLVYADSNNLASTYFLNNASLINMINDKINKHISLVNSVNCSEPYKSLNSIPSINYNKYFNYLSNTYIPEIYKFSKDNYNEDIKKNIIDDTIFDIVNSRNEYYDNLGQNNYLVYNYSNGKYIANAGGSYGNVYMGTVPTSAEAAVALSWKQGGNSSWATYPLGNTYDTRMGRIGCLVTSLAKIIKLSGTYIASDVFDPGVLAKEIKEKGGFSAGGGLTAGNHWLGIAPNFKHSDTPTFYISATSSNLSGQIAKYIGDKVGNGYCYIVYINYLGKDGKIHTHYIAVAGSENGEYILSDPATTANTYSLEKLSSYYNQAVLKAVLIYRASDGV